MLKRSATSFWPAKVFKEFDELIIFVMSSISFDIVRSKTGPRSMSANFNV